MTARRREYANMKVAHIDAMVAGKCDRRGCTSPAVIVRNGHRRCLDHPVRKKT
jgi:hypothetical protein